MHWLKYLNENGCTKWSYRSVLIAVQKDSWWNTYLCIYIYYIYIYIIYVYIFFFPDGTLATDNGLLFSSHVPFNIPFRWVQEINIFIDQYINETRSQSYFYIKPNQLANEVKRIFILETQNFMNYPQNKWLSAPHVQLY